MNNALRYIPIIVLVFTGLSLMGLLLYHGISVERLFLEYYPALQEATASHFYQIAFFYTLLYLMLVIFGIPGGAVVSMAGGFLFGPWLGCLLSIIGATLGAVIIRFAIQYSFASHLQRPAAGFYFRMREFFLKAPVFYLLLMRSTPFFPFMAVNIVASTTGIRLWTYVWTTFIGLIPETLVFTSIGSQIDGQLADGQLPGMNLLLAPEIYLPVLLLLSLAILFKVPDMIRRLQKPVEPPIH